MPLEHPSDPGETTVESLPDIARNLWTLLSSDALKNTWSEDLAAIPPSAMVRHVEDMWDHVELLLTYPPLRKNGHHEMLHAMLEALREPAAAYTIPAIMEAVGTRLKVALSNEQHIRPYLRALERNQYITIETGTEELA